MLQQVQTPLFRFVDALQQVVQQVVLLWLGFQFLWTFY